MYNVEKAVAFSPAGRYACRLGNQHSGETDQYASSLHIIDFKEESYYEYTLESVPEFVIIKFYWHDEDHVVVVYHRWGYDEGAVHSLKRIMYRFDEDPTKLEVLEVENWQNKSKRPLAGTGYFQVSEGLLALDGEEYFIYSDIVLSEGNRNYYDYERVWLRFIPKSFKQHYSIDRDTEIIVNYDEAGKTVKLDKNIARNFDEYILTAHNNYLYLLFPGLQILVMNIGKYLQSFKKTGKVPANEDFCSKITIPTPELLPYRAFLQYECFMLILKGQDKKYYLRISDFNTGQLTNVYQMEGLMDPNEEDDGHTEPNVFVHPSGRLVQFQTNSYILQCDVINEKRVFNFVNRNVTLIKIPQIKFVRNKVDRLKDLSSEQDLLHRGEDQSKLPRSLKEDRFLLELPLTSDNT